MKIKSKFLSLLLTLLLVGCYPRRDGDVFITSGKDLVVKREGKSLKFNLRASVADKAKAFVNGDDVFVVSMSNRIVKFSITAGAIAWEKSIGSIPLDNLSFRDSKKVYFTTMDNRFYVLDYDTGKIEFLYSNINEKTIVHRIKPIYYQKKNLVVVTFNGGDVIIFDGANNSIVKTIPSGKGALGETSVSLSGHILKINEDLIDLDSVRKK
ncbi:MAG: PQQ-like beta-propeller repeat protein [Rickettsiales bacterium]|jgi:outer membrane protein assembly factor BamB|nr:PQQ-like beta-propeller repeat protein [Rickettsiales bacterium]